MTQYKKSFRIYAAWNYQNEIEDLNKASLEGWQLVKGGCFFSKYVKNPDICYRYQMDFGKIDDMGRYIETFREQGWEYINSTFNGWHYFRKLYDPNLPEEAYEIFTDKESMLEMNKRWATIASAIGILWVLIAILNTIKMINHPKLPTLVILVTVIIEAIVLLRGGMIMRNPHSSRNRKGNNTFIVLFIVFVLLGTSAYLFLDSKRPYFTTEQQASSIDHPIVENRWSSFDIFYKDNYYFDISFNASKPMTLSIIDENDNVVFAKTDTSFNDEIKLKLPKGTYTYAITCTTGFHVKCSVE